MFDDLRPKGSAFDEEETFVSTPAVIAEDVTIVSRPAKVVRRGGNVPTYEVPLFGMTAAQRLVLAFMLFLNITVLGAFLLLATGSVVLPF
jgi:hypothetical protein